MKKRGPANGNYLTIYSVIRRPNKECVDITIVDWWQHFRKFKGEGKTLLIVDCSALRLHEFLLMSIPLYSLSVTINKLQFMDISAFISSMRKFYIKWEELSFVGWTPTNKCQVGKLSVIRYNWTNHRTKLTSNNSEVNISWHITRCYLHRTRVETTNEASSEKAKSDL